MLANAGEWLVAGVHVALLGILVVGGFLALRHRWVLPVHLGMVAWGIVSVAFTWDCPLTDVQQWLRALGGRPPLPGGFIDTYISGVIVPAGADTPVQLGVLALVLVSWALLVRRSRARVEQPTADDVSC